MKNFSQIQIQNLFILHSNHWPLHMRFLLMSRLYSCFSDLSFCLSAVIVISIMTIVSSLFFPLHGKLIVNSERNHVTEKLWQVKNFLQEPRKKRIMLEKYQWPVLSTGTIPFLGMLMVTGSIDSAESGLTFKVYLNYTKAKTAIETVQNQVQLHSPSAGHNLVCHFNNQKKTLFSWKIGKSKIILIFREANCFLAF